MQIIEELQTHQNVQKKDIIYINKEDLQWESIDDYQKLYTKVKEYTYIFIDEIQDIPSWEKAIRSLQTDGKHDVYITGSNSNLLSGELSTFLSGRYVSFDIHPLNYTEFLKFHHLESSQTSLMKYIKFG